ncbi:hypothetical protein HK100_007238 [Physocladia obscura]|uniref:Uncharacterized protein n=1 Tax=Physocladia obscura TaxID=109957 RepID=A0AAD5XK41_9FUNG|nr:hypothetical protein HK100_007238 [Physocladia obscura]
MSQLKELEGILYLVNSCVAGLCFRGFTAVLTVICLPMAANLAQHESEIVRKRVDARERINTESGMNRNYKPLK